jgi:hypothetical protein
MPNDVQITETAPVDTLDFINEQLDKEPETALAETTPDKPVDEIEISEAPEIKEDEISFVEPFKRSEVVKKFPTLFKDFPDLERKIYKSEKYEEIFPTLKDANEAKDRSETLESAESLLFAGDLTDILKSVRNEDEEAFKRIVENFPSAIERLDKSTYLQLLGNAGRFFIKNMLNEGSRFPQNSDQYKALVGSATILNQFLFGNSQFQDLAPIAKPVTEADNRISEREQQLITQRFNEIQSDLIERADNAITAKINELIDPKELMTQYVRAKAVDDAKKLLDQQINSDERFKQNLDRLWQNLIAQDFSKAAQEAIKTAFYNKARTLILDVIRKVRNEALSGKATKKVAAEPDDEPVTPRRANTAAPQRGQSNNEGKRKGESTSDYLNRMLG